jgi:hypothetical protein
MSQISSLRPQVVTRGRQLKFTPERIQQIKNLVERGKSRVEIAELIGVTVGSLQVTCSRLGVSLRRPNFNTGIGPLRRDGPQSSGVSRPRPNRGGNGVLLQLIKERPEQNSRSGPFAVKMQYRGEARTTELPLTQDAIGQLALEATFRNVTIGELLGELIAAVVNNDLLQAVLEHKTPR